MEREFESLERIQVDALNKILGKPIKVLDDGFVRVIDYMGTDESIVQAARVSYGRGTKKRHQDRGLIRYLIRHQHTTPFEMCEIKLHVRVPMDAWRQWIRHRTANVNEYSTRYSIAIDAAQTTDPDQWRRQASSNRQGSEGMFEGEQGRRLTDEENDLQNRARQVYKNRIEMGVAREQARKDLPLCTYTEAYWKIDLHNLLHFLELRMDEHAQHEIRQYARIIGEEIVALWCPLAWEAFVDYRLKGESLSNAELLLLKAIYRGDQKEVHRIANKLGWLNYKDGKLKGNLERNEFEQKLLNLGIKIPWDVVREKF